MKIKVKEIDCKQFNFNNTQLNNGTIYNIKYNDDVLEFQTPKLLIHECLKENGNEYLILQIYGTQACKTFYSKIMEIEDYFNKYLKNTINSVFKEQMLTVKIPIKYSKPTVKVYKDDSLFNYYNLVKDTEVICIVSLDKLWINNFNEASYKLTVKEILIV